MGQYDRQIKTAIRLIKRYGQLVTWRQLFYPLTPDPNKPYKVVPVPPVDKEVHIAFFTVDRWNQRTLFYKKDTEIPIGTLIGYMAAPTFTPEPNLKHIVLRGEEQLSIRNFDILSPNEQNILYTIEFER